MENMNLNRILYIDYARSIALFIVVFAHLYSVDSNVKLFFYAFHMPFFFLVSGILHRDAEFVPLLKKLTMRMLIPFCFFLLIGYLYFVLSSHSLAFGILFSSIKGIMIGKDITANDILWFLIALFWVRIMGNWFIRHPLTAFFIMALLSSIAYCFNINYLFIETSLMALPFYLLGYYLKKIIHKIISIRWHFLLLLSFILFFITMLISNYNGKVSMMGCSFGKSSVFPLRYFLFYLNGLIGSMAILCLGRLKVNIPWLLKPSQCAISIVGLQFIPVMIWYRSIGFNHNYLISCIYTIFILMGCIFFHTLVERKAKWLLGGK